MSLAQYVDCVLDTTRLSARLEAAGQRADALPPAAARCGCARRSRVRHPHMGGTTREGFADRPASQVMSVDDEILLLTSQKAKA